MRHFSCIANGVKINIPGYKQKEHSPAPYYYESISWLPKAMRGRTTNRMIRFGNATEARSRFHKHPRDTVSRGILITYSIILRAFLTWLTSVHVSERQNVVICIELMLYVSYLVLRHLAAPPALGSCRNVPPSHPGPSSRTRMQIRRQKSA